MSKAKDLLKKAQKVSKGESLEEAEIDYEWLTGYAQIAQRTRDDKDFGINRYPYEKARPWVPSLVVTSNIASGQNAGRWRCTQVSDLSLNMRPTTPTPLGIEWSFIRRP